MLATAGTEFPGFMTADCSAPCSQKLCKWQLLQFRRMQCVASYNTGLRSITVSFSHLRLNCPSGRPDSAFLARILLVFIMILVRATRSTLLSPLSFGHIITIIHNVYILWKESNKSIFEKLLYYTGVHFWNIYKPTIIQFNKNLDVNLLYWLTFFSVIYLLTSFLNNCVFQLSV
jgi:hypothetical protein